MFGDVAENAGKAAADEITGAIPQVNQDVHALLDRLNGTKLTANLLGHEVTFTLTIPERKS